jgi:hypothetical protein
LHNLRPLAARKSSFARQQQEEASNGEAKFRVDTYTGWKYAEFSGSLVVSQNQAYRPQKKYDDSNNNTKKQQRPNST